MKNKTFASVIATAVLAMSTPAVFADDWRDNDETHYQQNQTQYISHEKAAQAALNKVGGGHVEDVEFERSTRGDYFDVEVRDTRGREWDVRVNAKTGTIISAKRDD